ncbi:hypothetical protein [Embleya scabrispora]|uniref:hypothetical protein n=1 Tax=Embleya scabrispora TaxID=159449 RepID=UPI00036D1146|nr:hypothetical protein [Embleya scabrispora]MYS81023.1 hypothetical protein [Streptomyces sp. SID5474]
MSDFDARIEAERQRLADPAAGAGVTSAARRPADWARIIERIESLLAATAAEFDSRGIAALPVFGYLPARGLSRLTRRQPGVVDRRRPVLDLFSLDHAGRPFLERGAVQAQEIWLRNSHPGRANALRAAVLRAGLTPDTPILRAGPPILLDPDEAILTDRAGGCFGIAADGTLLVHPPAADNAPIPLIQVLTTAVTNTSPQP